MYSTSINEFETAGENIGEKSSSWFSWSGKPETTRQSWFTFDVKHKLDDKAADLMESSLQELIRLRSMFETTLLKHDYLVEVVDKVICILITVYNMYHQETMGMRAMVALQSLVAAGILKVKYVTKALLSALQKVFSYMDCKFPLPGAELRAEGGEERDELQMATDVFRETSKMFVPILEDELQAQAKTLPEPSLHKWAKTLSAIKSISGFFEHFGKLLWKVVQWSYEKVTGHPLLFDAAKDIAQKGIVWMGRAQDLMKMARVPGKMVASVELCNQVILHGDAALVLEQELMDVGVTRINFSAFFTMVGEFRKVVNEAKNFLGTTKSRSEPVLIGLSGPPNCGKSVAEDILINDLYVADYTAEFGNPPTSNQGIRWERDVQSDYAEGYYNQFATTFDDGWQKDDLETRTKVALELIRMINNAPYPLDMAFDRKGSVFFNSKFVILSQNGGDIPKVNLEDKNALLRRFDFFAEVSISDDFVDGTGTIRKIKIPKNHPDHGKPFSRDAYKFKLRNLVDNTVMEGWLNYSQFFQLIRQKSIEKTQYRKNPADWAFENPLVIRQEDVDKLDDPKLLAPRQGIPERHYSKMEIVAQGKMWTRGEITLKDVSDPSKIVKVNGEIDVEEKQTMESTYFQYVDRTKQFVSIVPPVLLSNKPLGDKETEHQRKLLEVAQENHLEFLYNYKSELAKKTGSLIDEAKLAVKEMEEAIKTNAEKSMILKVILGTAAVVGAVGTMYWVYKFFFRDEGMEAHKMGNPEYSGVAKNALGRRKLKPVQNPVPANVRFVKVGAHGGEMALSLFMEKTLKPNMGRMCFYPGPGMKPDCCGFLMVEGTKGIVAKHMWYLMGGKDAFVVLQCNRGGEFRFKVSELQRSMDAVNDTSFFVLPLGKSEWRKEGIQEFRNIKHHFLTDKEADDANISHTTLFFSQPGEGDLRIESFSTERAQTPVGYGFSHGPGIKCLSTVTYPTGTMPGMCTSPIVVHNTFITTKILAHHVAGGPHSGVGAVLTQSHLTEGFAACEKDTAIANEYWKGTSMSDIVTGNVDPEYSPVMELVEQVGAESQGFQEDWVDETKEPMLTYDVRHNYRGQLKDKALWVRFPHKSEIIPSLLAGEIREPTTGPAALAKFKHPVTGEEVFPLQKALAKLVKIPGNDFDRELEDECERIIMQSIPCVVPARLLTWEETIRGVEGWQFTRSMRTDTALGFTGSPKKGKGKSEAVWRDEKGQLHFQEGWKEKCIHAETGYKQGLTGFGANTLHLKDERRKLTKVENGDTRPFIGSFFVHYCNWRRRFCSFFENLAQARHLMGACIGINPHSTQWQALLMYLQEVGLEARALEGDASNFDNSGETKYNEGFVRIVNGWYGIHWTGTLEELEEDNRARDAIYREVSGPCAYVIVGKDIIQPSQFFGSGGLNTFGVNCVKTLKNSIYLPSRRARRVTQVWDELGDMWQDGSWKSEEKAIKNLKLLESLLNQRQEKWSTRKVVEFCESTHGMRMFTPGTIKEWTRCASGGDDIVMTLAEIMEWFTFEMWCEEAKAIGYTYTTSRKDGSMYDAKDLSEVTFLKRRFDTKVIPGLVTAPMELEDLEEILNWQTVKMEKHEAAHELVRCVLFELFHYGRPTFEEKMEQYNKVLVRKGCKPVLLSYVDLMHQFLDESGLYEEPKYSMIAEAVGLQMEIAPLEAQMKVGENEAQGRTFSSQISELRGEVTRLEHTYAGQPGVEEASQILRDRLRDLEEVSNVQVFIPTRERLKMKLQEKQIKKELGKCVDIMKAQGKTGVQDSLRNKFYAVYNFAPVYEYSRMESGIWVAKSTIFGRKWDGAGVNKKEAEECLLEEMMKELKILENGEVRRDVVLLEKAGKEKRTGDETNTKLVKVPEVEFESLVKQLKESSLDPALKEKVNKLYQMRAQGADWGAKRPTISQQQQRISNACKGEFPIWGHILRFAGPVTVCRLASTSKAFSYAAENPLYWRCLFAKMIVGMEVGTHPKEHIELFDNAMIQEFKPENFNPTVFWSVEHPWKEMCRYFMERDRLNELAEKHCEEDTFKILPRLQYHLSRDYKLATLHAVHENLNHCVTKPLWKSHVLNGRPFMPYRTAFVDEFLPNCEYVEFSDRLGKTRQANHCHFAFVYWALRSREYVVHQRGQSRSEMVSLGTKWKRDIKAIMKHSIDHWDMCYVDWEADKWEYILTCCSHGDEKCIRKHQYDSYLDSFKETTPKDWFEIMNRLWKNRIAKLLKAMDGMELAQKEYERSNDLTRLMAVTGQMLVVATDTDQQFPTVCEKLGYMSERVLYAHSDNQAKAGVEAVVTEEITDLQAITTLSGIAEPDVIPTGARFQPWKGKENPLQTEKIGSIFEREYQIGGFTWSGSTTAGTIIQTWAFPDALIGFAPNLQEKLSRFHYFKANMTAIDVSISANQFYSGMLMCNWIPFSYSTAKLSNIWTASTCNPVLIPAGEPARIRIEMPWVNNKTYWTDESLGDGLGHMGFFQIMIMHPLSLIGSTNTPSVPVAVWAHFEGADPAGPSLNAHSGSMKEEQKTRSKGGPISAGLNAMADVAVTMFSRTLMDPRLAAGTAAVSMGLKALASAARKAGLSNPISLKSEDPILNHTTSSFANSTGLDAAMTMTLDPAATVSNDRSVFGCSDIVDSYKYLGMLPGLFDTWSFDGTSVSGVVVKTYRIRPSMCATFLDTTVGHKYKTYLTPLATCAYPHKYWRGTIKICMVFNCPQFMRAEVRGSWHPTFAEIPPSFATGAGDFVSRTWQIQGTTIITFSIPYFQEEFFKEVDDPWVTNSANENGAIAISIVNPVIQGNTVGDSTIYVSSWVAGDEDMDFMFPYARVNATGYARTLSNSVVAPSGTKIAQGSGFEHSIVKIFEQDFPSLIPASALTIQRLNGPEVTQSVKQLMTRYCYYGTTSFTSDTSVIFIPAAQIEGTATTTDAPDTPQALFMNWFNYRRGSWNCKFVVNGAFDSAQSVNVPGQMYCSLAHVTTGGTIESSFNGANQHQGIVMQDLAHRGCLEFNVPFFHPRAFIMNTITRAAVSGTRADADRVGIQLIVESIATKTTNCRIYLGVGDDFSMGWPVGCPVLLYVSATLDEKKTGGNRPEDPMSFVRIGGLGDANNVLRPAGADRIHRNIG